MLGESDYFQSLQPATLKDLISQVIKGFFQN